MTLWLVVEVNPKVRVRAPEQEEEECVYPENDSGSWMLSKFIELLYFEEGKFYLIWCLSLIPLQISVLGLSWNTKFLSLIEKEKNHSVSKSTRVCPQHVTMRSTPSIKGWDFPWYISLALLIFLKMGETEVNFGWWLNLHRSIEECEESWWKSKRKCKSFFCYTPTCSLIQSW